VCFLTIPIGFGLVALGSEIISVLFERGSFDEHSVSLTYFALLYHAPGIIFISINRVFISVINAAKKFKLLFYISSVVTVINVALSFYLSTFLSLGGIAFASTLSQLTQTLIMFIILRKLRLITFPLMPYFSLLFRQLLCGGLILLTIIYLKPLMGIVWNTTLTCFLYIAIGGIVYIVSAYCLRVNNLRDLLILLRRKKI